MAESRKIRWRRILIPCVYTNSITRRYIATGCPNIYFTGYGYTVYDLCNYGYMEDNDKWFRTLAEAKAFAESLYRKN